MEIILFIVIILTASILQTSTGFGFSILATPFLLLLFPVSDAIQINLVLSLLISAALISKIRHDIDFDILKRLIIGSIAGMPIGIAVFVAADMEKLKLGISLVILLLTLLLILSFRIRQTRGRDFLFGGLSGSLTTSIGMPGPPLLLYFSGTNTQKEKLRGTTLAFYLFIYSISLVLQIFFTGTHKTVWLSSAAAIPVVLLGLYLGQRLFHRIDQRTFRYVTYAILLFTGGYLLFDSLG
ncbi:sulfite exporter TauE/SafE family protein [Planococcus sp. X10-3]|uniref:sulfite exporter TauE/SafE family protein n=1 Tax=Planococcus sp. X10-3 TaxID=3061240 RepID=UPI003BAEFD26